MRESCRSLNYLPVHVHRHDGAARTRQKQELQTTDDSSANARLVCGTKPVQKLHTLEMNDMPYAYSENFIEIVGIG